MADEEKRILDRVVEEQDDDTVIHVGSKTNYFFIGTKKDYAEMIENVEAMLISTAQYRKDKARTDYRCALKQLENLIDTPDLADPDDPSVNEQTIGVKIREKSKLLNIAYGRFVELKHYLADFAPLRTRLVKEVYPRKCLKDGVVIIVEGDDLGEFWDKAEFDKVWRGV